VEIKPSEEMEVPVNVGAGGIRPALVPQPAERGGNVRPANPAASTGAPVGAEWDKLRQPTDAKGKAAPATVPLREVGRAHGDSLAPEVPPVSRTGKRRAEADPARTDNRLHAEPAETEGGTLLARDVTSDLSTAHAVVRYAIKHLTEREACVKESKLVAVALTKAVGLPVTADEVRQEIAALEKAGTLIPGPNLYSRAGTDDKDARSPAMWAEWIRESKGWDVARARRYVERALVSGMLVKDERSFTTPKALKQEKAVLAIERAGRGVVAPLMTTQAVDEAVAKTLLNDGQKAAVQTILSTNNRFVGIQGDAGTGKTFAVRHAVELMNEATKGDYKVLALAAYGNQVKMLKQDGLNAKTLASYLYSRDKKIDDKTIVVLDEAAIVGSRQLSMLMRSIEEAGARLVMLGDTKQTEAIEAGKPFAQLQQAGMETARISEVLRQRDPALKRAVEKVAAGNVRASIREVEVIEIAAAPERHQAIVDDLMQMTPDARANTLVIAGTNAERQEINALVRRALALEGQGRQYETLSRVDMTQAERRVAESYPRGTIIQPERDYPKNGLVRWQNYKVIDRQPGNQLTVKAETDGAMLTINPRKVTKISVYKLERAEMAVGDVVRVTRNDIAADLTNGDRLRIIGAEPGRLTVARVDEANTKPLELDARVPLHLMHAYSSTVHSSQGMTSDNILISLGVKNRTTSQNLYYVAISRARDKARIYTNSAGELPDSVSRLFTKTTALSLQKDRQANQQIKQVRTLNKNRQPLRKQQKELGR
jgi:hypothetical protein